MRRWSASVAVGMVGSMTNAPRQPASAAASAVRSVKSATAISAPSSDQARPFSASRTTARTGAPLASSSRAVAPPTWPVTPVIAYILGLLSSA